MTALSLIIFLDRNSLWKPSITAKAHLWYSCLPHFLVGFLLPAFSLWAYSRGTFLCRFMAMTMSHVLVLGAGANMRLKSEYLWSNKAVREVKP